MQIKSIIEHDTIDPRAIEVQLSNILRLLSPAIKLPDHTPVRGRGIATKPNSKKHFLNELFAVFTFRSFVRYLPSIKRVVLSCKNPVVLRPVNLAVKKTRKKGRIDPKKENKNELYGVKIGLFKERAKGIATLPSSPGIIATITTASHRNSDKFVDKKSNISTIILFYIEDKYEKKPSQREGFYKDLFCCFCKS